MWPLSGLCPHGGTVYTWSRSAGLPRRHPVLLIAGTCPARERSDHDRMSTRWHNAASHRLPVQATDATTAVVDCIYLHRTGCTVVPVSTPASCILPAASWPWDPCSSSDESPSDSDGWRPVKRRKSCSSGCLRTQLKQPPVCPRRRVLVPADKPGGITAQSCCTRAELCHGA